MNWLNILVLLVTSFSCYVESFNINELTKEDRCTGPGSDPQKNHYFNGKCNCKRNVKGKYCSVCKKNSFHLSVDQPAGCLKCQCSSLSKKCHSGEFYMDKLSLKFQNESHGVQLLLGDSTVVSRTPGISEEHTFVKDLPKIDRGFYYWKLPDDFLGDKLTSYGGFIAYEMSYKKRPNEICNLTDDVLVVLKGNGITLQHFAKEQRNIKSGSMWHLIPLWEQYWSVSYDETSSIIYQLSNTASDYRCSRKKKRAKRKHLIRVLTSIDSVMIKANMHSFAEEVRLHHVLLSVGTTDNSTGERIYHIEQCTCPKEYDGLSCQYCSKGYKKVYSERNHAGFACVPCECSGNSLECNQLTGVCLNCQNNSTGEFCERKILHCDETATHSKTADRCVCKARVTGEFCTECKRGFFNKSPANEHICERCWCSGVTHSCESTRSGRITRSIRSSFINLQTSYSGKKLIEAVNAIDGEAVRIGKKSKKFEYWLLPKVVTGNLLKSYGGNLGFSIMNVGSSCLANVNANMPLVRIEGHGNLYFSKNPTAGYVDWKFSTNAYMNASLSYRVKLVETDFVNDFRYQSKVNRNTFLKLLSSVKHIKIYIPACNSLKSVSINGISLEILSETVQGGAPDVEKCFCPQGYTGLSCENCAKGYTRHKYSNHCKKKY